mgnify:CR=1 FL=1
MNKYIMLIVLLVMGCSNVEPNIIYPELPQIQKPQIPKLENFEVYALDDPRSSVGVDLAGLESLFLNLKTVELHVVELHEIIDMINDQRHSWNKQKKGED